MDIQQLEAKLTAWEFQRSFESKMGVIKEVIIPFTELTDLTQSTVFDHDWSNTERHKEQSKAAQDSRGIKYLYDCCHNTRFNLLIFFSTFLPLVTTSTDLQLVEALLVSN